MVVRTAREKKADGRVSVLACHSSSRLLRLPVLVVILKATWKVFSVSESAECNVREFLFIRSYSQDYTIQRNDYVPKRSMNT